MNSNICMHSLWDWTTYSVLITQCIVVAVIVTERSNLLQTTARYSVRLGTIHETTHADVWHGQAPAVFIQLNWKWSLCRLQWEGQRHTCSCVMRFRWTGFEPVTARARRRVTQLKPNFCCDKCRNQYIQGIGGRIAAAERFVWTTNQVEWSLSANVCTYTLWKWNSLQWRNARDDGETASQVWSIGLCAYIWSFEFSAFQMTLFWWQRVSWTTCCLYEVSQIDPQKS